MGGPVARDHRPERARLPAGTHGDLHRGRVGRGDDRRPEVLEQNVPRLRPNHVLHQGRLAPRRRRPAGVEGFEGRTDAQKEAAHMSDCKCGTKQAIVLTVTLSRDEVPCGTCGGKIAIEGIKGPREAIHLLRRWVDQAYAIEMLWFASGEYEDWAK